MNIQDKIYDSRDDVKNLILSVINGEVKEVELPFNNIKHYIDLLKSMDVWEYITETENLYVTIGFSKDEVEYYLSGDMYDSKTLNFSISK